MKHSTQRSIEPSGHRPNGRLFRAVVVAGLTLGTTAAVANHAGASTSDSVIGVGEGRYTWNGQAYAGLDTLESAVRSAHPASVTIISCSPDATPAWLATVPRFEDVPMHLDVAGTSSLACPAKQSVGLSVPASAGDVDAGVRRYWSQRMP